MVRSVTSHVPHIVVHLSLRMPRREDGPRPHFATQVDGRLAGIREIGAFFAPRYENTQTSLRYVSSRDARKVLFSGQHTSFH